MTAAQIIDEIKRFSKSEQAKVLEFAQKAAENRRLSPEELGALAKQMVESQDPLEADRLQEKIVRGFYGA